MGALQGQASYLRFLVDGEIAKNPGAHYEKALEARRFLPLDPLGEVLESAGWVPLESPYDDGAPLTRDVFLFGDTIAVCYREDKYQVPKGVLVRETRKRLKKIADDEGKPLDALPKALVKAIEKAVQAELKQKTLPRSKLVDVLWDTRKSELRVFGRGTVATERIASLVERTFQVRVDLGVYAARAYGLDIGTRALGVLERLSPGWLFPDAYRPDPSEPGSGASEDDDDSDAVPDVVAATSKKGARA